MWCIGVIAWNSFRETLRDKLLYNLLLFALFLIGGSVVLGELTIYEQKKIVMDMGLAAINLMGVIIAVFVGIGLVSKEIERRTIYTIMARPISRFQFILGKYCGLALTLFVNVGVMVLVFFATLFMDQILVPMALFQAIGLIFVELLLVTAIALFFSTFTSATLSAMLTLGFYVIGHLSTDLKGLADKSSHDGVRQVIEGLYYLCPNFELLNIKGQAAAGVSVAWTYQAWAMSYGMLYAAALVAAACLVFQRRDF